MAALSQCAHLLAGFGGHAAAAGFSLEAERIPELRAALSRAVAAQVPGLPEPVLVVDAYVELPDLTLDLVADLNRLAPFGPGNPPLVLAIRDLRVLSEATIGRTGEHRRLVVEDAHDRTQTVFWWQGAGWPLPSGRFDLALTVRASDYRGVADIQVEWLDARVREEAVIQGPARSAVAVRDYRDVANPEAVLRGVTAEEQAQIWAEGQVPTGAETRTRRELVRSTRLAIWTAPPGPRELEMALARAQPEEVLLFVHDPGLDKAATFLPRLVGLVKYALRTRAGQMDLDAAAARLAHRTGTVMAGLECLAAQGTVYIMERQPETWQLATGTGETNPQALDQARGHLDSLLAESAAYRAYVRTAPTTALLNHQPLPADG
jgi:single-stranded-DNA-specific exonuclease